MKSNVHPLPFAQLLAMPGDDLLAAVLKAYPHVEAPAMKGLPQWALQLLFDAYSNHSPIIDAAKVPAPLAALQQWQVYGFLGGTQAHPWSSARYTLAAAMAEVDARHERLKHTMPLSRRGAGFALHDGWAAVLLHWFPGEPLPAFMLEIIDAAVASGAYYEQHRDGAAHVLVGTLDADDVAPGPLSVVEIEGRYVRVLTGSDPDPSEQEDSAGVIPLFGGGTLRDPTQVGRIGLAASIAGTYAFFEPSGGHKAAAKPATVSNLRRLPLTTAKAVHGPKDLKGANLKAAYVLKGLAAASGGELSAAAVRDALAALHTDKPTGAVRAAVKRATDALAARGVLAKTAGGWLFDGSTL